MQHKAMGSGRQAGRQARVSGQPCAWPADTLSFDNLAAAQWVGLTGLMAGPVEHHAVATAMIL